jgi:hypothetical protein
MSIGSVKAQLAQIRNDLPRAQVNSLAACFDELADRLGMIIADTGDQEMLGAQAVLKHLDEQVMTLHRFIGSIDREIEAYAEQL